MAIVVEAARGRSAQMLVIIVLVAVIPLVLPMESSKALEGYPQGYLPECPGSTKPAIIAKRSLKHLGIVVQGSSSRRRYTYHQMAELARDPALDFRKKTLLFVGGYLDSPNFFIGRVVATKYLELGYNVLLLDAHRFTTMYYPVTSRYTRPVGKHTAIMISQLIPLGLDLKRLEILGISLGGQTIGFIGKNVQALVGRNVSRITALDPSGPCFRSLRSKERLDQADADFVDVINTNIDTYGMAAPVGHVNFYVNGGEYQPGEVVWLPCTSLCSHIRSFFLWVAALDNPSSMVGLKCDSVQQARRSQCYDRVPLETNVVGLKTDRNARGIFYVATDNVYPYALGDRGLKQENIVWKRLLGEMNEQDVMVA